MERERERERAQQTDLGHAGSPLHLGGLLLNQIRDELVALFELVDFGLVILRRRRPEPSVEGALAETTD